MKIFGHRGAAGLVDENTLESIVEALRYPIDGIEIDVHCCKSGELVVIHDETVDRTTNGKGKVSDYTLSELKRFSTSMGYAIPSLTEVLDYLDARCQLNVELKGENTAKHVVRLLQKLIAETHWEYDHFIISSFDHPQLHKVKELDPRFKIGVLTEANAVSVLSEAKKLAAYAIHPPIHLLTKAEVIKVKTQGFKVFTWTINEKELITQSKLWNVDGIITDFPNFAI